jgi:hypothetical protein
MGRLGPQECVSGWRIRWSSAGRAGAIAAAALAGIAVLPSLLGGSEPPPLPADVGLAPAATPPPPSLAELPPAPQKPAEPQRSAKPVRAANGRHKREAAPVKRRREHRSPRGRPEPPALPPAPVLSAPVYAHPLTPTPPEFGFER